MPGEKVEKLKEPSEPKGMGEGVVSHNGAVLKLR
ncbi:MAG: hypothetical protein UX12_C0022G0002 [Candidatus Collierbacteria bacterium GW2011_GWC1_45_47]|nr:MAG: hypothetical protein UX12_C0022G0002 [Candidatus Collierbacteria bacterium GW2011_GWC1_45_47]